MLVLKQMKKDVPPPYSVPDWSTCTDAEVLDALSKHYEKRVDLTDYWAVGDERPITISVIQSSPYTNEAAIIYTDYTLVILNHGGKELKTPINGISECAFIVGFKEVMSTTLSPIPGVINSTATTTGGWDASDRRKWCNDTFYNAIPSTLIDVFKEFKNITAKGSGSETKTSIDYFALAAEKELMGEQEYPRANSTAESSLSQFEYYREETEQRIKRMTNQSLSEERSYWTRSVTDGSSTNFVYMSSGQSYGSGTATNHMCLSPFGVM